MEPEKKQGLKAGQRNGKLGMGTSTERKRMPGNTPEEKEKKKTSAAQDQDMEKEKTVMGCRTEMKDDKKEGERRGQKRREKKKRER